MAQLYYYLDDDEKQHGPFGAADIRKLIKIGAIGPMTHFRTDKMNCWVYAFNIKGMFPEFNPHEPTAPAAREKPWGYRALVGLVRNPVRIFGIILVVGMVLQAYRSLAVPWLFPPNQQAAPKIDRGELFTRLGGGATSRSSSAASHSTDGGNDPSASKPTNAKQPQGSQRKIPDGNSPAGEIHRGIMGDQWCIKPDRMFTLPESLPEGRFFFEQYNSKVIFAATDGKETLNRSVWPLASSKQSDFANSYDPEFYLGHIKSYAQADRFFSGFVAPVENAVLFGRVDDWKKLSAAKRRLNFTINSNLGIVTKNRAYPINFVTLAMTGEPGRYRIAISDWDYASPAEKRSAEQNPDALAVVAAHRLRLLTWPGGQPLADKTGHSVGFATLGKEDESLRGALEGVAPYKQLAFSPQGDYLAGMAVNGQVDIYSGKTLDYLFTVEGVHMGGPYIENSSADQFVAHRLCFSPDSHRLLLHDRGSLALCDLRTEQVVRIRLPGRIQAYCFDQYGDALAASTETGEVYRFDPRSQEVTAKMLLAGLGSMCAYLNFSADGESLSGIFQESLYFGGRQQVGCPPTRWALFWNLRHEPSDRLKNAQVWHCQSDLRSDYPGHQGKFVCFAAGDGTAEPRCLLTVTQELNGGELRLTPFRALAAEAQKKALLLHSLVERVDDLPSFEPQRALSYDPPAWKPIHQGPGAKSVVATPLTRTTLDAAGAGGSERDDIMSPMSGYGDPLQ